MVLERKLVGGKGGEGDPRGTQGHYFGIFTIDIVAIIIMNKLGEEAIHKFTTEEQCPRHKVEAFASDGLKAVNFKTQIAFQE